MIHCKATVETHDVAKEIALELVEMHIAASVHINKVESIYGWEGKVYDTEEWELHIVAECFADVKKVVDKMSEYICTECVFVYPTCE